MRRIILGLAVFCIMLPSGKFLIGGAGVAMAARGMEIETFEKSIPGGKQLVETSTRARMVRRLTTDRT